MKFVRILVFIDREVKIEITYEYPETPIVSVGRINPIIFSKKYDKKKKKRKLYSETL